MTDSDLGGDPPCWAHILDDNDDDDAVGGPLIVDLGTAVSGSGGAIWSLPHGGDLDANLVRLAPGDRIGEHVNNDVDVLVFVQSGNGEATIGDARHALGTDHLMLISKGERRSIDAGSSGITYLSVHRRRSPLGISSRPDRTTAP